MRELSAQEGAWDEVRLVEQKELGFAAVPCFFIDDDAKFYFGKKNISQILDLIEQEEANA